MARPKKNTDERRDFSVAFRCTNSEYEKLSQRAMKAKMPVNSYARKASLLSKIRVVQEQTLDFSTRQELSAIGNNLNQIAHALNARKSHAPGELEKALSRLNHFFDEVLPK